MFKRDTLINQGRFNEELEMYDQALEINSANADTYSKKVGFILNFI